MRPTTCDSDTSACERFPIRPSFGARDALNVAVPSAAFVFRPRMVPGFRDDGNTLCTDS
jgi:hypothetical protein